MESFRTSFPQGKLVYTWKKDDKHYQMTMPDVSLNVVVKDKYNENDIWYKEIISYEREVTLDGTVHPDEKGIYMTQKETPKSDGTKIERTATISVNKLTLEDFNNAAERVGAPLSAEFDWSDDGYGPGYFVTFEWEEYV